MPGYRSSTGLQPKLWQNTNRKAPWFARRCNSVLCVCGFFETAALERRDLLTSLQLPAGGCTAGGRSHGRCQLSQ